MQSSVAVLIRKSEPAVRVKRIDDLLSQFNRARPFAETQYGTQTAKEHQHGDVRIDDMEFAVASPILKDVPHEAHAFVAHFLPGERAAFVLADLGTLNEIEKVTSFVEKSEDRADNRDQAIAVRIGQLASAFEFHDQLMRRSFQ